jgi:hypothetical protein
VYVEDLTGADPPICGVLPTVCRIKEQKKRPRAQQRAVEPIIIIMAFWNVSTGPSSILGATRLSEK